MSAFKFGCAAWYTSKRCFCVQIENFPLSFADYFPENSAVCISNFMFWNVCRELSLQNRNFVVLFSWLEREKKRDLRDSPFWFDKQWKKPDSNDSQRLQCTNFAPSEKNMLKRNCVQLLRMCIYNKRRPKKNSMLLHRQPIKFTATLAQCKREDAHSRTF